MRDFLGIGTNRGHSMIGTGIGLGLSAHRMPIGNSQFNPTQIAGLQLWLDGSDSSTLFQSNGGSLASSDGDPVGYWLDKSGNSRHVTQASGVSKPSVRLNIKNGLSVVRFTGTQFISLSATLSRTSFTYYWAFRRSSSGIRSVAAGLDSSWVYPFTWWTDNATYAGFSSGDSPTLKASDTSTGYFILDSKKTGSGSTPYTVARNGEKIHDQNVNGTVTINTIGRANTDYHDGDFLEFLAYDSELTGGDNQAVLGYLNSKWGIY